MTSDSSKNCPPGFREETVNPRFPDLEGKHVLITGGANGIGAAVAIAFAGQGCEVTLLDKDLKAGERVVGACRALGAKACLREVDLVDSRMLCDVLDHVKREQPTVDVLVLNAGYDPRFTGLEMTEQQWSDLFQLNVTHYFLTCRELVPAMVADGGGGIIMTASHTVWLAKPDLIAYNSTKAAVVGFMRSLAEAVGRDRIRVNAVAPGWTMTDRQLRQWVTEEAKYRTIHELQLLPLEIRPEDLTGTYLFLASDSSAPITRQVLAADAGQSKTLDILSGREHQIGRLPMKNPVAACTWVFGHHDMVDIASRVASLGLAGAEVFLGARPCAPRELRRIFEDHGLQVFSMTPDNVDIAHVHGPTREQAIACYDRLIDFADEWDRKRSRVTNLWVAGVRTMIQRASGTAWPTPAGVSRPRRHRTESMWCSNLSADR